MLQKNTRKNTQVYLKLTILLLLYTSYNQKKWKKIDKKSNKHSHLNIHIFGDKTI